jgi:hypothetical protein
LTNDTHRQLLIRCEVVNRDGAKSVRFVERSHFRMWQYLMANKHHIRVLGAAASLWLPEAEWQQQAGLFERAGLVEPVTRLCISVYDAQLGLCNTTQRFVPQADVAALEKLLVSRLPEDARANDDYAVERHAGRSVLRTEPADLADLGRLLGDQFPFDEAPHHEKAPAHPEAPRRKAAAPSATEPRH